MSQESSPLARALSMYVAAAVFVGLINLFKFFLFFIFFSFINKKQITIENRPHHGNRHSSKLESSRGITQSNCGLTVVFYVIIL